MLIVIGVQQCVFAINKCAVVLNSLKGKQVKSVWSCKLSNMTQFIIPTYFKCTPVNESEIESITNSLKGICQLAMMNFQL